MVAERRWLAGITVVPTALVWQGSRWLGGSREALTDDGVSRIVTGAVALADGVAVAGSVASPCSVDFEEAPHYAWQGSSVVPDGVGGGR